MGVQLISSSMPFDLNIRLTFESGLQVRNKISISSNDSSINADMQTVSEFLADSFYTQTNINELIWHGMQLVSETIEVPTSFDLDLTPPKLLNSAEDIRTIGGDELFDKIKAIVDDQVLNRDKYFARLKNRS
ncbi:hypothetical protein [uncultured Sphaerochaeta sp.]|uniref:hypothetical protein n=1 Tax=uncultured Sphaerochaeta sp. TaxID=886478 RepID=UPI0029C9FBCD|nr:hypothetical protein [uncultured Sphaerochaeta sp.]